MKKSALPTIQLLFRIARILSKIVFVVCTVALCLCAAGLIALAAGLNNTVQLGGVTIQGLVSVGENFTPGTAYAHLVAGMIGIVAEMVLAKLAQRCCEHELAAGTPFTFAGAKEMQRLGILTIVLPLAAVIISGIVHALFALWMPGVTKLNVSADVSVSSGILLIVLALIFRYGAEVTEGKAEIEHAED